MTRENKGVVQVELGAELRSKAKAKAAIKEMTLKEYVIEAVAHYLMCGCSEQGKYSAISGMFKGLNKSIVETDKDDLFRVLNEGRESGSTVFVIIDEWCGDQATQTQPSPVDELAEAAKRGERG